MRTREARLIAALALALLFLPFAAAADAPPLATEDDKTLYALGLALSSRLPSFDPTGPEIAMIQAGIADGLNGKEPRVKMADYFPKLDPFIQARVSATAEKEKVAGAAFREEAAKQTGAVKSDSGLIYKELQAGTGAQPDGDDTVKLHYHGTRRDGTVFDSSRDKGEPAEFALNQVVEGWTIGLSGMKVGSRVLLAIPPDLGYGAQDQPNIPANSTLYFVVDIVSAK